MTWKTIEAAREIRQWSTQIVIPTITVGVAIVVTPDLNPRYVESKAMGLSLKT